MDVCMSGRVQECADQRVHHIGVHHTACSIMVNRLLRFVTPDCLIKCFWAWDATCVGVRVGT